MVVTVDNVIDTLFSALVASSLKPPKLTTEDAWYQQVCSRLMEAAAGKGKSLWTPVDNLGFRPRQSSISQRADPQIF